jgi:hypothetical protein
VTSARALPSPTLTLAFAACLSIVACSGSEDPIRATLDELEEATETRDADRLAARLSEGFRGKGSASGALSKADAAAALRRYFAAYESVSLTVHEPEVEARDKGALVRCAVEFSGKANAAFGLGGLLPGDAVYRFELELADEGGTWRVERAAWTQAAGGP